MLHCIIVSRGYLLSACTLQVITLDHDKYERELNNIPKSHSKSIQARDNMKLRPVRSEAPKSDLKARLPKLYRALEEDGGMLLFILVRHRRTQSYCLHGVHVISRYCTLPVFSLSVTTCLRTCSYAPCQLGSAPAQSSEKKHSVNLASLKWIARLLQMMTCPEAGHLWM